MKKEKDLSGKRYIGLVRCSSNAQSDTSLEAQAELIDRFARDQGMVKVDTISLSGVSGSIPGIRGDIPELIRRKREADDFDTLVLQDASRLTRSGPMHAAKLMFDLRAVGVRVVFVKDDLPEGDLGDVMRSLQFLSSKEQARSIAHAATRGSAASLKEGRSAHCKRPPYGVDRLYTTANGTAKHIIRNLPDGTQIKLHPQTGEVLERFGRNEKSGVPAHYIKQKNECIVLVPGDPNHVGVVNEIFDRHFRQGWGYARIAKSLNERGVSSPAGGLWYVATVRTILLNTIYLGVGMANVLSSAVYYVRGADGPVEADVDVVELSNGRPRRRVRPQADWVEREEERLADVLDESVRSLAREKQQARLDALAGWQPQPYSRDRHRDSEFILKGILTSRQGGHPMTGRRTGKKNHKIRYYAISKAFSAPTGDRVLRRMVPAEPVEQGVLAALRQVLLGSPELRLQLVAIVRRELQLSSRSHVDVQQLQAEKARIERQMGFLVDELDEVGREVLTKKMDALRARLKEIIAEMERAGAARPSADDADRIVDRVLERLRHLGEDLDSLPPASLRALLEQFVSKLVVDLETRAVEVELALPDWSGELPTGVCLDTGFACKTDNEAHPLLTLMYRLRVLPGGKWELDGVAA